MVQAKANNEVLVMIGLMIGLIFSELDETVVSTAMPTIIRDLHGLSLIGWVAGIYMLSMTIFMPILGKLADIYGRKLIYLSCIALFITGSIVCGTAPSMTVMLIGRAIQGIGAGGMMPLAMLIIGDSYEVERQAKIQSFIGPLMILPQLLGPTVGGFLVGHVNWHWVFFINIPVGLIGAAFIAKGMRESRGTERKAIDWLGALTLVASLLSLLMAPVLVDNRGLAWSSPVVVGLLALFAVLVVVFILIERKVKEPILPLHLFKNRTVVVLSLLVFTLMFGVMGSMSSFPFFSQNVMGLTPVASGYLMLAFMAGAIPISIVNSFFITKLPYKYLFVGSFLMPVIAFYMLTQISASTTVIYILVAFFIAGLGMGVMFGSDNLIVQNSVKKEHSGIALSTVQLFQALGMTIGLSIFGSMLANHIKGGMMGLADQLPAGMADTIAKGGIPSDLPADILAKIKLVFADSFQQLFVVALFFVIAAAIICFFMKREVLAKMEEEKEETASAAAAAAAPQAIVTSPNPLES